MNTPRTHNIIRAAAAARLVVPGFNIPYLPMMEPVVAALRDADAFGLIQVARLEWIKFEAGSIESIREEYERVGDDARHTRLHLDHVPVIDEDGERVDYMQVMSRALELGYGSVMIDGSRLPLEENIECTRAAVQVAHASDVPVEAELGAVLGHEQGPLPPYEELFASGKGFTDPDEATRFVRETGADWLSVAIGNIHGAISAAGRGKQKPEARLNIGHLVRIRKATGVPLVLHGGSGIRSACIADAIREGIAKINIATAIRQPYERALSTSGADARDAVYRAVTAALCELQLEGTAGRLCLSGGAASIDLAANSLNSTP